MINKDVCGLWQGEIKYQSTWTTVTTPKCFVFSSATVLSRNSKPPQMLTNFAQNEQIWLTQRPPLIEAGNPSLPLPVRDDMTTCKYLKRYPNKGGGHFLLLLPILDLVQKYPLTWTPKKTNYNKLKCWAQSLRCGVMAVAQWRSESARENTSWSHLAIYYKLLREAARSNCSEKPSKRSRRLSVCISWRDSCPTYCRCPANVTAPSYNGTVWQHAWIDVCGNIYPHYSYNVCFHLSSNGINEKLQT